MALFFPKPPKRQPKPPKPLRRSRKRIAARSAFKADYGDGKRSRCRTDAEVWALARKCQRELIEGATPEEIQFGVILRNLGVKNEFQKIWLNGDLWIISDYWLADHRHTVELDGSQHKANSEYDRRKSIWLAKRYGVGTIRFYNRDVENGVAEERIKQMFGLNLG